MALMFRNLLNRVSAIRSLPPLRLMFGQGIVLPKVDVLLVSALLLVTVALGIGVSGSLRAEAAVLSDMDCIVEPSALVDVGSAVPGLLAESLYDKSDFVGAGTVLARLESETETVTLAIAEQIALSDTSLELRKLAAQLGDRTQARNLQLLEQSAISRQNMDQVTTEARIAQLQVQQEHESQRLALLEVERARAQLARREIRSPVEGSIVSKFKNAGEYVDNDPVYRIAQLDPLHVEVIVPIDYLGSIQSGMFAGVTILAPGYENQTINAVVRRIDAVSDAGSATYGVRLLMENPELKIPSGVRCQIDFLAS